MWLWAFSGDLYPVSPRSQGGPPTRVPKLQGAFHHLGANDWVCLIEAMSTGGIITLSCRKQVQLAKKLKRPKGKIELDQLGQDRRPNILAEQEEKVRAQGGAQHASRATPNRLNPALRK
jgi:hypothetical protein